MSAQMKSELTQSLLLTVLKKIAKIGSLIILENAHWMDSASWSLTLAGFNLKNDNSFILVLASKKLEGVLITIVTRFMIEDIPFQYNQILHNIKTKRITLKNLSESETESF